MKQKRGFTGPFTSELARHVGQKDYTGAIRYLNTYLETYPDEVCGWTLLAQCHRSLGSDTNAIESATMALRYDSDDFEALRILGEIYANRNEHDKAVDFVRRALANYPKPSAPLPRVAKALRLVAPLLPKRLRRSIETDLTIFEDPGANDRKWFALAKEYLAWYDGTTGSSTTPVVH